MRIVIGLVIVVLLAACGWLLWQHQQDNDQIQQLQSDLNSAQYQLSQTPTATPTPTPSPSAKATPVPTATPKVTPTPVPTKTPVR